MDEIRTIRLMLDRLKKEKKVLITELATSRAENKYFDGKVKEMNTSIEKIEEKNYELTKSEKKKDRILHKMSRSYNKGYEISDKSSDISSSTNRSYEDRYIETMTKKYKDLKKEYLYQVQLNRKLEKQLQGHLYDGQMSASLEQQERSYQNRKIDQLKSQVELEKQKYGVLEIQNEKYKNRIKSQKRKIRDNDHTIDNLNRYKRERDAARKKVKLLMNENENLKTALLSLNLIMEETKRVKVILEKELSGNWDD